MRSECSPGSDRLSPGSGAGRRELRGGAVGVSRVRIPAAASRGSPALREAAAFTDLPAVTPVSSARPTEACYGGTKTLPPRMGPAGARSQPPRTGFVQTPGESRATPVRAIGRPAPPGRAGPPAVKSTGTCPGGGEGGNAARTCLRAHVGQAVPGQPNPLFQSFISVPSSSSYFFGTYSSSF